MIHRRRIYTLIVVCCLTVVWKTLQLHDLVEKAAEIDHDEPYFLATFQSRLRDSFDSTPSPVAAPPAHVNRSDGTFSACLLVMDDNHFLIEWLAYHYHVLPLGHLILATDPRSQTSPQPVLDRYKSLMDIQVWTDEDYMTEKELQDAEYHVRKHFGHTIVGQQDLIVHRARQRIFYYQCMRHLKEQGRDWVVLTDTDEFVHVNAKTISALGLTADSVAVRGSVMRFLTAELQRPGHNLTSACVQIPRIRYGAVESSLGLINRMVPAPFNASLFQTLRWRYHASSNNQVANRISKTMIDLSRVAWDELEPVDSIHRPIRRLCGHRRLYIRSEDQVFLINHYLGSWEQYNFRNDSRTGKERSRAAFNKVALLSQGIDDDVRLWLRGFVHELGLEKAKRLLEGVGELSTATKQHQ